MMSDLKRAHSKRTTEQQNLTRDSLRAALVLQQLRAHHLANWAELEADEPVWSDETDESGVDALRSSP